MKGEGMDVEIGAMFDESWIFVSFSERWFFCMPCSCLDLTSLTLCGYGGVACLRSYSVWNFSSLLLEHGFDACFLSTCFGGWFLDSLPHYLCLCLPLLLWRYIRRCCLSCSQRWLPWWVSVIVRLLPRRASSNHKVVSSLAFSTADSSRWVSIVRSVTSVLISIQVLLYPRRVSLWLWTLTFMFFIVFCFGDVP